MRQSKYLSLDQFMGRVEWSEIGMVLLAMLMAPLLIHLFPSFSNVPNGAVWLPIFYAPIFAVRYFRPHVSFAAGLLAPTVNFLLTGRPAGELVFPLTVELLLFSGLLVMLNPRWGQFVALPVLAYLATKLVSVVFFAVGTEMFSLANIASQFFRSLRVSLPGLCVLFLLSAVSIRLRKKGKR